MKHRIVNDGTCVPYCSRCGATKGFYSPCLAVRGLGDAVERILSLVGITQRRYLWAKAVLGLKAECNCDKRKQRWNTFSARLREWLGRLLKQS